MYFSYIYSYNAYVPYKETEFSNILSKQL